MSIKGIKKLTIFFLIKKWALYQNIIFKKKTVKTEGALALYKGFLPLYIRLAPWNIIVIFLNFIIFDYLTLVIFLYFISFF